jgi:hypothetical protein
MKAMPAWPGGLGQLPLPIWGGAGARWGSLWGQFGVSLGPVSTSQKRPKLIHNNTLTPLHPPPTFFLLSPPIGTPFGLKRNRLGLIRNRSGRDRDVLGTGLGRGFSPPPNSNLSNTQDFPPVQHPFLSRPTRPPSRFPPPQHSQNPAIFSKPLALPSLRKHDLPKTGVFP